MLLDAGGIDFSAPKFTHLENHTAPVHLSVREKIKIRPKLLKPFRNIANSIAHQEHGLFPVGHFKFPHLWSPKIPRAGRQKGSQECVIFHGHATTKILEWRTVKGTVE
jgi:hypothetical protein